MHTYIVDYAFISSLGASVFTGSKFVQMLTGSETEALVRLKQSLNGSWKMYGKDTEVIVTRVRPQ